MAKTAADHLWHDRSDYVLALGIGIALPILRAILDAILFKVRSLAVGHPPPPTPPGLGQAGSCRGPALAVTASQCAASSPPLASLIYCARLPSVKQHALRGGFASPLHHCSHHPDSTGMAQSMHGYCQRDDSTLLWNMSVLAVTHERSVMLCSWRRYIPRDPVFCFSE